MAPEQLEGGQASQSSDVNSFALTIYEVCCELHYDSNINISYEFQVFTGQPPFPETPDMMIHTLVCKQAIRPKFANIAPPLVDLGLDETMWSVMESCWPQEPWKRWTAEHLCDGLSSINTLYSLRGGPQDGDGPLGATPLVQTRPAFPPMQPLKNQQPLHTKSMSPSAPRSAPAPAIIPLDPESIQFFSTGPLGIVLEDDAQTLARNDGPVDSLAPLGTGVPIRPGDLNFA